MGGIVVGSDVESVSGVLILVKCVVMMEPDMRLSAHLSGTTRVGWAGEAQSRMKALAASI